MLTKFTVVIISHYVILQHTLNICSLSVTAQQNWAKNAIKKTKNKK